MLLAVGGDIHGKLNIFFRDILALEKQLGLRFDHVLHVGDFGIWPDPSKVDKATRKHNEAGDFPHWFKNNTSAPRPTSFINGNHEDFDFLQGKKEILPNLNYIPSGTSIEIQSLSKKGTISVAGLGGCYGPSDYKRKSKDLQGYAKRHYTEDQIQNLPRADILLLHDAPFGIEFKGKTKPISDSVGLDEAVRRVRPRICFFGHHHTRVSQKIDGVQCEGLNIVGRPGNIVAIEMPVSGRDYTILGEYPSG